MATKKFPDTLRGFDNTITQRLCSFDLEDTPVAIPGEKIAHNWGGEVSPNAQAMYDGTPLYASAIVNYDMHFPNKGYYGPKLKGLEMAPAFFKRNNAITFVMQVPAGGLTADRSTFIGLGMLYAQPDLSGIEKMLRVSVLDGNTPGLQRPLVETKMWTNLGANDWILMSLCLSPPIKEKTPNAPVPEKYEPYIMIGDTRNGIERIHVYENNKVESIPWSDKWNLAQDDSDGTHTPKVSAGLFEFSYTDAIVRRIGIYAGVVNGSGLTALKNSML